MEKRNVPPAAKRLMIGLRDLGYDFATAIADLVDNSIAADATVIHVDIFARHGAVPARVVVADNGNGISKESLVDAMRFGGVDDHSYEDLGKYGLGLKTASLSQAQTLTVASRAAPVSRKNQQHLARWDLTKIEEQWDLYMLTPADLEKWEREAFDCEIAAEQGTVVLWSAIDSRPRLSARDPRQAEGEQADLVREVSSYLAMVFHRFLLHQVPRRRKLEILVCGQKVTAWDPFCRTETTRELPIKKVAVPVGGDEDRTLDVTFAPFVLPAEREFSSPAAHKEAGQGGWNQRQGLYFYRNNRLLQAGGWSYLRAADEHNKLLRVAVDFPGALDKAFNINVSKMRAQIPPPIRESMRNATSAWSKIARSRYDRDGGGGDSAPATTRRAVGGSSPKTSTKAPAQINSVAYGAVTVVRGASGESSVKINQGNAVRLTVEPDHAIFRANPDSLSAFVEMLLELMDAVAQKRMRPDQLPLKSLRRKARNLT